MQKAEKYLESIVQSSNREEALAILHEVAKDLGIGQSYGQLVTLKERLDLHKTSFRDLQKSHRLEVVPTVKFLQNLRMEVIHCYQEITDELSTDINRLKIAFGDDRRTEVRGSIVSRLMQDKEFQEKNKAKSVSAIEKIYGTDDEYKEWLACSQLSYGLWNDYRDTMRYINMFIDALASQIRTEQAVERMDFK